MKLIKLTLVFATLALAVGSAASTYSVKFFAPTWVGDNQLKAGEYKLAVEGDKATFTSGKNVVEVPVTVEKNDKKYSSTTMQTSDSKLSEINLAGTDMKLMFKSDSAGKAAGSK